jgi:hypothetical protein
MAVRAALRNAAPTLSFECNILGDFAWTCRIVDIYAAENGKGNAGG